MAARCPGCSAPPPSRAGPPCRPPPSARSRASPGSPIPPPSRCSRSGWKSCGPTSAPPLKRWRVSAPHQSPPPRWLSSIRPSRRRRSRRARSWSGSPGLRLRRALLPVQPPRVARRRAGNGRARKVRVAELPETEAERLPGADDGAELRYAGVGEGLAARERAAVTAGAFGLVTEEEQRGAPLLGGQRRVVVLQI